MNVEWYVFFGVCCVLPSGNVTGFCEHTVCGLTFSWTN